MVEAAGLPRRSLGPIQGGEAAATLTAQQVRGNWDGPTELARLRLDDRHCVRET